MTAAKAWVAAAFLVIEAAYSAVGDNVFDLTDTQHIVSALIVAAGGVYAVYQTPNRAKVNG